MGIPLKQSTASQEIPLGYFLDSGNGNDEETGLTIANTDIKLWKHGATTLANKNSGGATHISNGIYYCTLDDTDTNTLGSLIIFVHVSGALAIRVECEVYPANVFDSLFGTDKLQVDIAQCGGSAVAAGAIPNAAADAAGGLPISDAGGLDIDTKLANTNEVTAARMGALTDWIDGGRLDLLLDAIPTTAMRGTDNAALASVCTEARLAELDAGNLPTDVATVVTEVDANETKIDTIDAVVDAIKAITDNLPNSGALTDIDTGINNIEAKLPSKSYLTGSNNTDGDIQMDEATGNFSGSVGSVAGNVTGSIGSLATQAKSDINAEILDVLNTDTFAEPGQESPAATTTLAKKIGYLYKFLRNKITNDGTVIKIYNDAKDTVDQKASVSETDGTVTRDEFGSGP